MINQLEFQNIMNEVVHTENSSHLQVTSSFFRIKKS